MDGSLLLSGLLIGLAGSPHCVAMCAAPCTALASRCDPQRPRRALLAWHAGRALAYAGAGALAAAGSGALFELARASVALKPLWTLLQVAAMVLGLWLLVTGRAPYWSAAGVPGWLRRVGAADDARPIVVAPAGQRGAFAIESAGGSWRAGVAGLAWVAWPCGLLYAALAVATLGSTPWHGVAVMSAFALGSSAGLAAGSWLWRLGRGNRPVVPPAVALRLAGALLTAAGLWALWRHGVAGEVQAWCLPS